MYPYAMLKISSSTKSRTAASNEGSGIIKQLQFFDHEKASGHL
jgi:hypothetical protein